MLGDDRHRRTLRRTARSKHAMRHTASRRCTDVLLDAGSSAFRCAPAFRARGRDSRSCLRRWRSSGGPSRLHCSRLHWLSPCRRGCGAPDRTTRHSRTLASRAQSLCSESAGTADYQPQRREQGGSVGPDDEGPRATDDRTAARRHRRLPAKSLNATRLIPLSDSAHTQTRSDAGGCSFRPLGAAWWPEAQLVPTFLNHAFECWPPFLGVGRRSVRRAYCK